MKSCEKRIKKTKTDGIEENKQGKEEKKQDKK